ncbi:uncharacterized protein BXIN_2933 [Babesia sp. Xinjiang]|uniref:uncharacterized protein n=1 Tax=Babesia sp. Xinjiang TaxID=462227 RepID=UPI000A256A5E|nr:uncharacterized protein BXIN_2933 [Babesia sp. Xinjiang]ORM39517.1 hypothetical protein BXIN_2933 [Babesia sp. Xinjiang]
MEILSRCLVALLLAFNITSVLGQPQAQSPGLITSGGRPRPPPRPLYTAEDAKGYITQVMRPCQVERIDRIADDIAKYNEEINPRFKTLKTLLNDLQNRMRRLARREVVTLESNYQDIDEMLGENIMPQDTSHCPRFLHVHPDIKVEHWRAQQMLRMMQKRLHEIWTEDRLFRRNVLRRMDR